MAERHGIEPGQLRLGYLKGLVMGSNADEQTIETAAEASIDWLRAKSQVCACNHPFLVDASARDTLRSVPLH